MEPTGTDLILLVEDNADDEELTRRALKRHRLANELVVARDGQEAVDTLFGPQGLVAQGRMPHLILLDLKLPKLGGLEVLERIRSDARTQLLPVAILTSSDEEDDLVRGYELGANSYVRKPVDFDEFVETVERLGLYWLVINHPAPSVVAR